MIGLPLVALAARRYLRVQKQIREQRYEASGTTLLALAAILIALGLLTIWHLLKSA